MIDCFVTFCEDDKRIDDVKLLIGELRERTNGQINFHAYFEKEIGSSLEEFMTDTLCKCECIIGLYGPEYKKRIDNTMHYTGAYQEYDTMILRIDGRMGGIFPKIIPILWSGKDINDSVPSLIMNRNPIVGNLSEFQASGVSQGKAFLPRALKRRYDRNLDDIANALISQSEIKNDGVISNFSENLERMLNPSFASASGRSISEILQLKFEHGKYETETFRDTFFTSTRFFRRLSDKNVGLISGRKGSGKTTLVQVRELEAKNSDFFPVIDVSVNNWNLHQLIHNTRFRQSEGDFQYVDLEVRFFDFVWAGFISFAMIVSLEFEKRNRASSKGLSSSLPILSNTSSYMMQELLKRYESISNFGYAELFDHAVSAASGYIQKVVDRASSEDEEKFRSDVLRGVSVVEYLYDLFGEDMNELKREFFICGAKRFLFCFDRFDTEIQQYRKIDRGLESDIKDRRAQREVNWLSSLVQFVNKTIRPDMLSEDRSIFEFFSRVKFLVVLPYDRITEIKMSQRDSVSSEAVEEIYWQPKELLTMLRKRVQVIYNIDDERIQKSKNRSPKERFEVCRKIGFSQLPSDTFVGHDSKKFRMDLFLYVLRHTFFRPRDILIHYAALLGYLESLKGKEPRDLEQPMRDIVADQSQRIVESEFIGELADTWTNINEVLNLFMGARQVMNARELREILRSTDFEFYHMVSNVTKFEEKIHFLFEIGFVGFRSTREIGSFGISEEFNFVFLNKMTALPFDSENVMKFVEFAIHPIFVEKLYLISSKLRPVLLFDWKVLDDFDRLD